MTFPADLDSFTDVPAGSRLDNPNHRTRFNQLAQIVRAIEERVGVTGSAVTTSHDYRLGQLDVDAAQLAANDTALQTLIDALDTRLDTDETNISANADAISTINGTLTTLDTRLDAAEPTIISNTAAIAANLGKPMGLTGATAATRFVGGRASAPPVAGTFAVGDQVNIQDGRIFICTVAGTPGTWTQVGAQVGGAAGLATADYIVYKSGANYLARNTLTNTDDFTSTNAAAVVQSAHDAGALLIEVKSGQFDATSRVNLTTPGAAVRSRPSVGESQPTKWNITGQITATQGAFDLSAAGTLVDGIAVECNGLADYGIHLKNDGSTCFNCQIKEADVSQFAVGPGAGRCTFFNIQVDNGAANGAKGFEINGPDHIAALLRAKGAEPDGWAFWTDTSRLTLASGHFTANNASAGCVYINGDENRLEGLYLDTGPSGVSARGASGIGGQAHVVIKGNGNYLQALVQNAATRDAAGATFNVTSVAFVSGTTYRFTTSVAHGFIVNDTVRLTGFVTTGVGSPFIGGSSQVRDEVVTAQTTTTFDINLGSTGTFTDQVGTAKRKTISVIAVTGPITGNVYRFQTSTPHGYIDGDAVMLQGFASSNGAFQTTTEKAVMVAGVPVDSTHFDADLGAATTFTDDVGTAKGMTKYAVALQRASSTAWVLGNELHLTIQGDGAGDNDADFLYALGFLSSDGSAVTGLTRFAGNNIFIQAANCANFANIQSTWGSLADADKVSVDCRGYVADTTAPIRWRTKAWGVTTASTGTTWTINHGLAGLPTRVLVTPRVDTGAPAGVVTRWWVSSVTATQVVITASAQITNMIWAWEASM